MQQDYPELPKTTSVILGADNGKSGSLVFLDAQTAEICHIEPYPNDAKRLHHLIQHFKPKYAAIEEVFMAPGFKGVASSNFIIMGRYMQVFEELDIPYETVRAVSWRRHLGIKAKGRDAQKEAAISYASIHFSNNSYQKLFSTYRVIENHKRVEKTSPDNNKCESALIALYALQKFKEN